LELGYALLTPITQIEIRLRLSILKSKRTLTTTCTTHVIHDGLADMLYVLLPVLAEVFHLSYFQVGLIRSAHRIAMAALQIPAGILSEIFGIRNLLVFGTLISGVAFILLSYSTGFLAILFLLVIAGLGSAFQHPLCSALVAQAYPTAGRRAALGTYNFAGDLGKFLFAGGASLWLASGLNWQTPVTFFGLSAVIGGLVIYFALGAEDKPTAINTPRDKTDATTMKGWGILDVPAFTALCGIAAIDTLVRSGFLVLVAFVLIENELSLGWSTLAVPAIFAGGMVGKLACGILAERIGILRTIVITETLTGIGIIIITFIPGVTALLILPLIGVALNGTSSVLYALVGDLTDSRYQARAYGFFYSLTSICSLIAPIGFGLLSDIYGVVETSAIIGGLAIFSIPFCIPLKSRSQSTDYAD